MIWGLKFFMAAEQGSQIFRGNFQNASTPIPVINNDCSLSHFSVILHCFEGVVAQWCDPLTLQPEKPDGVCLIGPHHFSVMTRAHRHDYGLATSAIPALGPQPHLHLHLHYEIFVE